jgi:hypothetical protein
MSSCQTCAISSEGQESGKRLLGGLSSQRELPRSIRSVKCVSAVYGGEGGAPGEFDERAFRFCFFEKIEKCKNSKFDSFG